MSLPSELAKRLVAGLSNCEADERSGLRLVLIRDNLMVYRYGARKLWLDLEVRTVVHWSLTTQAEARAFNDLLGVVGMDDFYEFVKVGRMVMLSAGGRYYHEREYNDTFGPVGRNHSNEGPPTPS